MLMALVVLNVSRDLVLSVAGLDLPIASSVRVGFGCLDCFDRLGCLVRRDCIVCLDVLKSLC